MPVPTQMLLPVENIRERAENVLYLAPLGGEECSECGSSDNPLKSVEGVLYCAECHAGAFTPCHDCSGYFPNGRGQTVNGAEVCDDCFESCDTWSCARCDENVTDSPTGVEVRGGNTEEWCDSCSSTDASFCDYCHDTLLSASSHSSVCTFCLEDTFVCDSCDERKSTDDYAGDGNCINCSEEGDDGGGLIRSYGYDVLQKLSFLGTPEPGDPFFGVELEVSTENTSRGEAADMVIGLLRDDFIVLKEDSSISDGFEIVTAPATLAVHTERWPSLLDDHGDLRSYTEPKCGMHIHISRNKFSEEHLKCFDRFFNCPATKTLIEKIAGRRESSYARILDKPLDECGKHNVERYCAINLQNDTTVEVRVFKGTLNKTHFLANLEFTHAAFRFTRSHEVKDFEGGTAAFFSYVTLRGDKYKNLIKFFALKELI